MDFFDDLFSYEMCFPGAITGRTEVVCPHCDALLTVSVSDPIGQTPYQCQNCDGDFEVDWRELTVTPICDVKVTLTIEEVDDDDRD